MVSVLSTLGCHVSIRFGLHGAHFRGCRCMRLFESGIRFMQGGLKQNEHVIDHISSMSILECIYVYYICMYMFNNYTFNYIYTKLFKYNYMWLYIACACTLSTYNHTLPHMLRIWGNKQCHATVPSWTQQGYHLCGLSKGVVYHSCDTAMMFDGRWHWPDNVITDDADYHNSDGLSHISWSSVTITQSF